jgi:hypothetical protein
MREDSAACAGRVTMWREERRRLAVVRPNVRVEAGPTVLRLAREAHHVPRRFAGQAECRWASPRTRG